MSASSKFLINRHVINVEFAYFIRKVLTRFIILNNSVPSLLVLQVTKIAQKDVVKVGYWWNLWALISKWNVELLLLNFVLSPTHKSTKQYLCQTQIHPRYKKSNIDLNLNLNLSKIPNPNPFQTTYHSRFLTGCLEGCPVRKPQRHHVEVVWMGLTGSRPHLNRISLYEARIRGYVQR